MRPPRTIVAWAAATLVALLTARVVATDLAALHRRAESLGPTRPVLVARRDVPLGARVSTADVRVVRRPDDVVPDRALHDDDAARGRVVAVPLLAGAVVTDRHLAPRSRTGLDGLVPAGSRAVRVPDDAGLRPPPGAVVDVLVALDPALVAGGGGGDATVTVAAGARVLATGDAGDGLDGAPAVTLLVTEVEAGRLAFAAANGAVTLALDPPEAACCTTSSSASSKG